MVSLFSGLFDNLGFHEIPYLVQACLCKKNPLFIFDRLY